MKVAHIVSTFPPYKAGIGNSAYHLSWELARLGNRITVVTPIHRGHADVDESLPFEVQRLMPLLSYGNASFLPQLLFGLYTCDILHLHYPFFGGSEMLYLRNLMYSQPLVLHYHMDVVGQGVAKRLFAWHSTYLLPRIIERATRIIVTSENYAQQSLIKNYYAKNPDKFVTVPLGVNPAVFEPRIKDKRLIQQYGLQNKKVVLFVGALDRAHYFKGVNYLIKAFQLISSNDEYRLLIVGTGKLQHSYQSIVTNFGLDRKVIFTGFVTDDLLPLYYNLADVYVQPSIDNSEAFGIALLEAMASGLPVIASDLAGVRTVVDHGAVGILVKPKQVDALAKQMIFLLNNPQVRNKLGDRARERVLQNYTWEIAGKKIHKLYGQLILRP